MSETAWCKVTVMRETEKAYLVSDSKNEGWIPKSQIIDCDKDIIVGHEVELELPLWLAEKKGLT